MLSYPSDVTERVLDWKPRFDERSRMFGIAVPLDEVPRTRAWAHGPVLDQGREGACVGFGSAANLLSERFPQPDVDTATAQAIYRRARQIDEWPGEDYDGTSVLAGMKTMAEMGRISEYRWCFGLRDVLHALSYVGPVQVGVNWYEGMFEPGADGFLHVSGNLSGGHCTLLSSIDAEAKTVTITNSWGPTWGMAGQAYLSWDDLGKLLSEHGEAVTITKISR